MPHSFVSALKSDEPPKMTIVSSISDAEWNRRGAIMLFDATLGCNHARTSIRIKIKIIKNKKKKQEIKKRKKDREYKERNIYIPVSKTWISLSKRLREERPPNSTSCFPMAVNVWKDLAIGRAPEIDGYIKHFQEFRRLLFRFVLFFSELQQQRLFFNNINIINNIFKKKIGREGGITVDHVNVSVSNYIIINIDNYHQKYFNIHVII